MAIPFIQYDPDTNKYSLLDEAVQFFEQVEVPFGIITIVGKYRTGKSFFMNQCLLNNGSSGAGGAASSGSQGGFHVGSTVQACTKGLWLYPKALYHHQNNQMPVFLLDTEGIGSLDATSTHDTRIFALALLFGSYFIYNSLNAIDEEALNQLSLVLNLCKQIRINSTDSQCATPEEIGSLSLFPPLLWIVRDFSLQLKNEFGQYMQPNEYLEMALKDTSAEKNELRHCIRSCFPNRSCATLIRPCNEEYELQQQQLSRMKPVFVEQLKWIRNYIFQYIQPKSAGGTTILNGRTFIAYARTILDSMNKDGTLPVIRDSWSMLSELQSREMVTSIYEKSYLPAATKLRKDLFNQLDLTKEAVIAAHAQLKRTILNQFRSTFGALSSSKTTSAASENTLLGQMDQDRETILSEFERLYNVQLMQKLVQFDQVPKNEWGPLKQQFQTLFPKLEELPSPIVLQLLVKTWNHWIPQLVLNEEQNQKLKDEYTTLFTKWESTTKLLSERDGILSALEESLKELQEKYNELLFADPIATVTSTSSSIATATTAASMDMTTAATMISTEQEEELDRIRQEFLTELKQLKENSDHLIAETKASYQRQLQQKENAIKQFEDRIKELQSLKEENTNAIQLQYEKIRVLEEKWTSSEQVFLQTIETIQQEHKVEMKKFLHQRLSEQLSWTSQIRDAETKAITESTKANEYKRKYEMISDPTKMKRLKVENQNVQTNLTRLSAENEVLKRDVAHERERNKAIMMEKESLLAKLYTLQREKERSLLELTLNYEKQLAAASNHL
jgi:hypothetical protein